MHDLVDKTYHIPYPSAGTDKLLPRLEYINSKENIQVIIPNFDAELYPFIKLGPELKARGIRTYLPTLEQFEERQKHNLPEFGQKYGFKVPDSKPVFDVSEIDRLNNGFQYPMVVKGKYYDAHIAQNPDQARTYFSKISSEWGLPVIIQEYIRGTEYNVTGLGDGKGNTIAAVPMKKQYITDKGKAWGGISISDEKLLALTRKFLKLSKWKGGFELELMKDNNNEIFILEINPRIPAWIYLAVGVGQNIPEALVNLALERDVKPFEKYDVGKMFIRYAYDMIVDLEEYQKISTLGEL
jgi:carbamoyl-phosphate synthase large subunit